MDSLTTKIGEIRSNLIVCISSTVLLPHTRRLLLISPIFMVKKFFLHAFFRFFLASRIEPPTSDLVFLGPAAAVQTAGSRLREQFLPLGGACELAENAKGPMRRDSPCQSTLHALSAGKKKRKKRRLLMKPRTRYTLAEQLLLTTSSSFSSWMMCGDI